MTNTVENFWKMILDKNVHIIACLNDVPSSDKVRLLLKCYRYISNF